MYTITDNIIANSASRDSISGILLSDISDHLPVFQILQKNIVKNVKQTTCQTNYHML